MYNIRMGWVRKEKRVSRYRKWPLHGQFLIEFIKKCVMRKKVRERTQGGGRRGEEGSAKEACENGKRGRERGGRARERWEEGEGECARSLNFRHSLVSFSRLHFPPLPSFPPSSLSHFPPPHPWFARLIPRGYKKGIRVQLIKVQSMLQTEDYSRVLERGSWMKHINDKQQNSIGEPFSV